jgi:hypothetical protein
VFLNKYYARIKKWARLVELMGERRAAYWGLVWKPEEKKITLRSRSRWEDNIKMSLHEI